VPTEIRLTTLLDRQYCQHPNPLVSLKAQLSVLDELARSLGVSKLSQFVDISQLELQEAERLLREEGHVDSPELAGSEPPPLDIEDRVWFPAALGMATLEALSQHIQRGSSQKLDQKSLPAVLDELAFCCTVLAELESEGGQFNLALSD